MPTTPEVLGFSNRWYAPAFRHSEPCTIGEQTIRLVSAPYFLATKLEAFAGRGDGDFRASHDLEDAIAVIDGRQEVVAEIQQSAEDDRDYLAEWADRLFASPRFIEALPGRRVLPSGQVISHDQ